MPAGSDAAEADGTGLLVSDAALVVADGVLSSPSSKPFTSSDAAPPPLPLAHGVGGAPSLKRTLGVWDLTAIGVGGIVGAGIYVLVRLGWGRSVLSVEWQVLSYVCALRGPARGYLRWRGRCCRDLCGLTLGLRSLLSLPLSLSLPPLDGASRCTLRGACGGTVFYVCWLCVLV